MNKVYVNMRYIHVLWHDVWLYGEIDILQSFLLDVYFIL
jgi:hypothetical protein